MFNGCVNLIFTFLIGLGLISSMEKAFFLEAGALAPPLEKLSLEEKVGQLLLVHFHGSTNNANSESLIHEAHVGGFIYYQWANELSSPLQVQQLSTSLQQSVQKKRFAIPLFLVVDQEGGVVNRLRQGFTLFPGNYALGQTRQPAWAEACAYAISQELRWAGINLNLAPVVDVNSNPRNPIIGIRAFSSKPEEVADFGAQALAGYRRGGLIATLKHFPGHGDVATDSHVALPLVEKSRAELQQVEWLPFYRLIHQAPCLMTAHLLIPAIDPHCCITFSSLAIEGLLRQEMGYKGVILTDSLVMQGILEHCPSMEEAALRSLQAGHDIVLLGGKQLLSHQSGLELTTEDILKIHRFLVRAVRQGRLSEERINQSVERILALKQAYGLFEKEGNQARLEVSLDKHRQLAQKIAREAIQVFHGRQLLPLRLQDQAISLVVPTLLREELEQTDWRSVGRQVKVIYFDELNPTEKQCDELVRASEGSDWCFFFSYNAWKYPSQVHLFSRLQECGRQVAALVVRDSQDRELLLRSKILVCTFSPTTYALQAAKDLLMEYSDHD